MDAQVIAAALGVVAGLVGAYVHRRDQVGSWLPHLVMGAAMGAMAVPRHDPLGPAGWMLLLGGTAAWAFGRPGPGRPSRRAAVALDLYVMGVLTLLMPALHGSGSGHGAGDGHAGAGSSDWWQGPYAGVLVVWILARFALGAADHRRHHALAAAGGSPSGPPQAKPSVTSACSAVMIAAMALMAFAP